MKILVFFIVIVLAATSVLAQSTPTPEPTNIPLPQDEIFQALATANAAQLSAPSSAGVPSANGAPIFGYAKWLVSPGGSEELFGPFAPVFFHLGIFIALSIALVSIYSTIYGASYMIRWIVFLYRLITNNLIATLVVAVIIAILTAILWVVDLLGG